MTIDNAVTASRLGHIGINVPDLQAAVGLFTEVFDMVVTWRSATADPEGDAMHRWFGLPAGTSVEFAFLKSPGIPVELELLQWAPSSSAEPACLADGNGRHVALWVDDLERTVDALRIAGCTVFDPHPTGFRYARTPWGLYLQLMPANGVSPTLETLK